MGRLIALDSGPLGMISSPHNRPRMAACKRWARDLMAAGVRVLVPEIADYEVRRELVRVGATAGVAGLDRLKVGFEYLPITTAAMLRAADFWAQARRGGRPGAHSHALDADCILAAQALETAGPGDLVTVATANVGHLGLFIAAQPWDQIVP